MKDYEKGFIVGIIEGEGSILFSKGDRTKNHYIIRPRIVIANTSLPLIKYCEKIFDKIRIKHCRVWATKYPKGSNRKDRYNLEVTNDTSKLKLLKLLKNFFICKKRQAELMIEFMESRKKNFKRYIIRNKINGQIMGTKTTGYTKRELEIYNQLKEINNRKRCRFWTKKEKETLIKNWPNTEEKLLNLLPLRKWDSIRTKAQIMGLDRR